MGKKLYPVLLLLSVMGLFVAVPFLLAPANSVFAERGLDVVAAGLNNPRGMAFGADGALYIAEAGVGGDGACIVGGEGEVCYGASGAITRVMSGTQERIADDLPSLANQVSGTVGNGATGPHDIMFDAEGNLLTIIGLGANPTLRDDLGEPGANFGQVVQVEMDGTWAAMADVATYEATDNPDGFALDSNPFGLAAHPSKGDVVATDAGANDLLHVASDGTISTLTVFPTSTAEFPPGSGTMIPTQAVPTGITVGPDGAYYVGELTGFPFPEGGANVYRIAVTREALGEPEVYADGFTSILDVAFDEAGNLYVLEMDTNGLFTEGGTGAVIRVASDGTRETIASTGLAVPTGMTIGPDGMVYVANLGPVAGAGQVVRIDPNAPTAVTVEQLSTNNSSNALSSLVAVLGLLAVASLVRVWQRKK